jgi:hypothetical protein
VDWCGSGQGPMVGSWEPGNESLGFIKYGEFLNQLSNYHFIKKDSGLMKLFAWLIFIERRSSETELLSCNYFSPFRYNFLSIFLSFLPSFLLFCATIRVWLEGLYPFSYMRGVIRVKFTFLFPSSYDAKSGSYLNNSLNILPE